MADEWHSQGREFLEARIGKIDMGFFDPKELRDLVNSHLELVFQSSSKGVVDIDLYVMNYERERVSRFVPRGREVRHV